MTDKQLKLTTPDALVDALRDEKEKHEPAKLREDLAILGFDLDEVNDTLDGATLKVVKHDD